MKQGDTIVMNYPSGYSYIIRPLDVDVKIVHNGPVITVDPRGKAIHFAATSGKWHREKQSGWKLAEECEAQWLRNCEAVDRLIPNQASIINDSYILI